jgi:hypothetical protein
METSGTAVLDIPSADQSIPKLKCSRSGTEEKPPTVRIFRTLGELEEIRKTWDLWCDDPDADIDYYLALARCRPDFVRPHVMVVYRDGRPDCMLIGRLESRGLKLRVGYAALFEPKVRLLFFVQGGFIGNTSKENSHMIARTLKQCFQHGEADSAEFSRLAKDSSLLKAAESVFGFLGRGHFIPTQEHRWLDLPGSFKEFQDSLSRKNRHELRRHERKLADAFSGKAQIHCYRREAEVDELAQEVEKISSRTYQRGLGVGFRPDAEILESLRTTARKGGLRGCVLYLDEKPCAFFIGKHYKKTFHGNFMGFDPEFGKYSPGLLVLMHSIEECFDPNMRATQFDLGWGDRQYKRVFCNQSKQDGPLYLYALSWTGLRLNFLRSTTSLLDLSARKLVKRIPFLQKIKRDWHTKLRGSESKAHSLKQECWE